MKKQLTAVEMLNFCKPIEVPYKVWTAFGSNSKFLYFSTDQICLGEEYKSLEESREAIEWYVTQLGGKVQWK